MPLYLGSVNIEGGLDVIIQIPFGKQMRFFCDFI